MRFLFLILAGFFGVQGFATTISSWKDLKQLIQDKRITNVDDLLAQLPTEYTDGFTLVYRTRALGQELVSANRPRVLLFGREAKLVIAYNSHISGGKAKMGDRESIETLAFDDNTGRSYLREVVFTGEVPDLSRVKANPQRCLACHGQSPNGVGSENGRTPRGLWDPYNSWSGVYGSLSRQGIDFIKLGTPEYSNFQTFLAEKAINPRYKFLKLTSQLMSQLPPEAFIRAYDPGKMNDALTFSDGQSMFPNQALGMHLANYNFARVGNILADQKLATREAFQYLVKGISLDENFAQPDIDDRTNSTDLNKKIPACLAKITSFLPTEMPKVTFAKFGEILLHKLRADYSVRKAAVEADNMGLSKLGAGLDPSDPYDENRGPRGLEFDSVNPATKFHLKPEYTGLTGNAALFYLVYLMDIPSQDLSASVTRGTNFKVDNDYVLSGSTTLYYGNSTRCYSADGKLKSTVKPYDNKRFCFSEPVEEFFTRYLPARFFTDENAQPLDTQLNHLSCDELAIKSREALGRYFQQ